MYKHMNACPLKGKKFQEVRGNPLYKVQEKFKGIRAFMEVGPEGSRLLTRGGHYVEHNFKHLQAIRCRGRFVLDGELYQPGKEDEVISGWANSKYLTDDTSQVVFQCFDIVEYIGRPLTWSVYQEERDKLRLHAIEAIDHSHILYVPYLQGDSEEIFAEVTSRGGEGLIYRNMDAVYTQRDGDNRPANHWYKEKSVETYDVVILGYTQAKPGKFEGMIGAVSYGMFKDGALQHLGNTSGMTDYWRDIFTQDHLNGEDLRHQVMEVKAAGQDPNSGALIEPRFIRLRADKHPTECIWEQV